MYMVVPGNQAIPDLDHVCQHSYLRQLYTPINIPQDIMFIKQCRAWNLIYTMPN